MPTVLRVGPYAFLFFAADIGEPAHVHIRRERMQAKFWIHGPVELEWNRGFSPHELNQLRRLTEEHQAFLLEKWNEFFHP